MGLLNAGIITVIVAFIVDRTIACAFRFYNAICFCVWFWLLLDRNFVFVQMSSLISNTLFSAV